MILIMLITYLICSLAYRGEAKSKSSDSDGWEVILTPYLWAVGLDGDMTVKGTEADVSEDFGDILDNLDVAMEAHFEIWKGNWGGFFDGTYVDLSAEGGSGPIDIDVDMELRLIDFGVLYRVGTWPLGEKSDEATKGKGRKLSLEVLLGGRYMSLEVDLDPKHLPLPKVDQSESWTDLIVGGVCLRT